MPRCNQGEMAFVNTGPLYGTVVEILAPAVDNEIFTSVSGVKWPLDTQGRFVWKVRAKTPLQWTHRMPEWGTQWFAERPISDHCLTPIRGDLTKEQMEAENLWSTEDERAHHT